MLPSTYTQPFREDYVTDGPRLRDFVKRFWKSKEAPDGLVLDDWQADLIDRVLERYPADHPSHPGQMRYQQVVISMGRQNGKTVIGAVLGLYALMMHVEGPEVISLASSTEQANIIYERVRYVIDNNPALAKRFKTTGTRGIRRLDKGGNYMVKPAKGDALQGIPVSMCLFDEVHICSPDMWSAMVMGGSARKDSMVIGYTTAGNDSSVLLKSLYEQGKKASAGDPDYERFGFFCWEAPAGADLDDVDALKQANPALAAGRLDLDKILFNVRTSPEDEARRYHLNQFQSGTAASFIEAGTWTALGDRQEPRRRPTVISVDRTPDWDHAAFTAAYRDDEGVIHTRLIASMAHPTAEKLATLCQKFYGSGVETFVMDGRQLGNLAALLKQHGYPVKTITLSEFMNACSTAFSLIKQGKVAHANDHLVNHQMPRAVKKAVGDNWRINRGASKTDIDAVVATVNGIYAVENHQPIGIQVF